nr:AP-1 complex subunit sigma-3 isoform X1 [Pelodiscus sinensis]|eukprot:XP_025044910.1 AP-1 complex subunit sigma-3 isoform X1 [Pelodiscus sinensis]
MWGREGDEGGYNTHLRLPREINEAAKITMPINGHNIPLEAFSHKIRFILLFSRQGKLRLQKWYITLPDKERKKITREIVQIILARNQKMSSFVDWKDLKLVYKRYASLYFCCAIEDQDNELLTLEVVHRYVELLDRYFGNVCELDIIFNFEKAYFILDEFIMGGEIQETSKKSAVKAIEDSDMLQETMEEYMSKPAF